MALPFILLKIGGSVATHKDRARFSVRTTLMRRVALALQISNRFVTVDPSSHEYPKESFKNPETNYS
jgi:isopentenyl phosphate kinase